MNKHRHSIPRELEEMKLIRNSHKHWETECHECFMIKAITYYVPFNMQDPEIYLHEHTI